MSSTSISKKLFENAEFVSSTDPNVDHNNLVFMDSDSEGSEKFGYDLHLQQTSLQEVVQERKEEPNVAIDITDNYFPVKQEEEYIIEDVPYEVESDNDTEIEEKFVPKVITTTTPIHTVEDVKQDEKDEGEINFQASTSFGGNSDIGIIRCNPPAGPSEISDIDEVQFELITDINSEVSTQPAIEILTDSFEEKNFELLSNSSLVDHQYSQPKTKTNKEEFCYDFVKNLLKDKNVAKPTVVPILEEFTEFLSHFVEDDPSAQISLCITSMSKTLASVRKSLEQAELTKKMPAPEKLRNPEPVQANATELAVRESTESQCSEQCWPETVKCALDDYFEIPQTQSSDEGEAEIVRDNVEDADKVVNMEDQARNEGEKKVKLEIMKIFEFGAKMKNDASELLLLPMQSDEHFAEAKKKLLTVEENLLKDLEKMFKDAQNQFGDKVEIEKAEERTKKKIIKELLDLSDFMNSSDSDSEQILNLNRKILKSGPQTPAIVSSTKEDSDLSETEVEAEIKFEPSTSRASSVESAPDRERNHGKDINRLLDFAALNFAKPASSKKISKKKHMKKKKKKIDDNSSSSSDDQASDSSSSNDERDTSDEEQQMLLRQNADLRDDLLAGSESSVQSDFGGSVFQFSSSSDDEEPINKKSSKKIVEVQEETKEEIVSDRALSLTEDVNPQAEEISTSPSNIIQSPDKATPVKIPDQVEAVSLVSDDEDAEIQHNLEKSRSERKRVKLSSSEREIFSKNFLEMNGGSKKGASTSSTSNATGTNAPISKLKTETVSPSKPLNSQGTVDVSMYENRRAAKDFDLEKMIEKRHFPNEPSVLTSPSAQNSTKPSAITLNDDECISLSSDSDSEIIVPSGFPKRKKMLTEEELQEETKKANKDEDQRVKRLEKKNKVLTQILSQRSSQGSQETEDELLLDFDPKKKISITVHPKLVKKLKFHQREGIKFMYDTCYGSIADEVKTESGCILAHCMGLGKTLQLITLVHTLIMHPKQLNTSRVLVICPKSTIANWYEEFKKWISREGIPSQNMYVASLDDQMKFSDRVNRLDNVHRENRPVVTLINYEAFRNMIHYSDTKRAKNADQKEVKRLQDIIDKCLLTGPDLVVCDEGHLIKNQTGATNRAITKIKTRRRIILTGTPVQNNLNEYYSMVDFIKPALLGTVKEFNNLYGTPIKDGQHIDSDKAMIKKMKQRSFILNKKLSKFVQRKEASVLREYLPEKHEYCIFVPLTKVQEDLYEMFLMQNPLNGGHKLLNDYTALRKIWTHPKVLQNAYDRAWKGELVNEEKRRARDDIENDQAPEDLYDSFDGNFGVKSKWWKDLIKEDDLESILSSNKFMLLFEILRQCQERNEKVLVFSAFVAVLNVVEEFMRKIHNHRNNPNSLKYGYSRFERNWVEGLDYYRLDGSTKRDARQQMIERFNDKKNTRMCCFLISARAGGQGINLTGANRCVILDTSWNPSADQQNIFRIYRLGQDKVCYVYRLIALGTMEEKVYSRSLTKQAMSGRVVDKQQIDRHYSMDELQQLYVLQKFDPSKKKNQPLPTDEILQYLLFHCSLQAFKYHDHDSLLENKPDQDLNEDEIKEAWVMYEQESRGPIARTMPGAANGDVPLFPHMMRPDLVNYNNYLAGSTFPFQPPFYNANEYLLQNLFNLGPSGYLNNIPSTSSAADVMPQSLIQNPFSNLVLGNGKAPEKVTPKRRQSVSKAKERQAMLKQLQGESLLGVDNTRKNGMENVSILPDDQPASHIYQAPNRSNLSHANRILNDLRKNKTLDVTRNSVNTPVRVNPAPPVLQAIQASTSSSTQRLNHSSPQPVQRTSESFQRLQSASPSTSNSPSGRIVFHPHQASLRESGNTISKGLKKKMAQDLERVKSNPTNVQVSKGNLSFQLPKPQTSTANLSQRSSSSNAINIVPKNTNASNANSVQRSNTSLDLSKTKGLLKSRIVVVPQTAHSLQTTESSQLLKNQALKSRPIVLTSTQQNLVSKNQGLTKRPVDLSVQTSTASKNILKGPPLNSSQRSNSSLSMSSQNSNRSIPSITSGSPATSQNKKIIMSPMLSQSARTSAAAPINVKYVQEKAINQSQPKNITKQVRVIASQVPNASRSVIHEASQNTIPQRDPKGLGNANGVMTKIVVDPPKKTKLPTNLPKGLVVSSNNNKPKQNVTFNNALNMARSLQSAGGTQEVSMIKIPKATSTPTGSKTQQPSTSVIRSLPQKRPGDTLVPPSPKRPNIGVRPIKIINREDNNRSAQGSMSMIEDIVEIE